MEWKLVASFLAFVAVNAAFACRDEYPRSRCVSWKNRGFCNSARYKIFMTANCKKTCIQCPKPEPPKPEPPTPEPPKPKNDAVDIDSRCSSWKSYCGKNEYVKKNCKKTCAIAKPKPKPKPVNGNWGAWSDFLGCTFPKARDAKKDDDGKLLCVSGSRTRTRSCNNPAPSNNGRKCIGKNTDIAACPATCKRCNVVQHNSNCNGWVKYCNNDQYKSFMVKNCGITCKVCHKPKPKPTEPKEKGKWDWLNGKCGTNVMIGARVVGGVDAKPGEFPWQVGMWKKGGDGWDDEFFCGGTLVDNGDGTSASDIVITASHCVEGQWPEDLLVKLGDFDRDATLKIEKQGAAAMKAKGIVKVDVKDIKMHPNYNTDTINNDIAILKLAKKVPYSASVQIACLPSSADDIKIGDGKDCHITGWGKTSGGWDGKTSIVLQKAKMPIKSRTECEELNNKNSPVMIQSDTMMCAGPGKDSEVSGCQGDSGGPLVCPVIKNNAIDRWVLHGAVSWGDRECKASEKYTVFARISHFMPWVEKTIKELQ